MKGFLEFIKLVGGIAGLGTALFTIYDRLYRDRPIFALHVNRPADSVVSRENDVYIRIKNPTDEDIIIDNISIVPGHLTLATGNDTHAIVRAMVSEFNLIVVRPYLERLLVLIVRLHEGNPAETENVTITATWRGTRRPWPWKRHVRIRTTVAQIRKLKSATI
jgi:hypothetical protein